MEPKRRRIYIAGPATEHRDYNKYRFYEAADEIADTTDLVPIHATWIPEGMGHGVFTELAHDLLSLCDLVCVLPGWDQSESAQLEVDLARDAGLPVIELHRIADEFGRARK